METTQPIDRLTGIEDRKDRISSMKETIKVIRKKTAQAAAPIPI